MSCSPVDMSQSGCVSFSPKENIVNYEKRFRIEKKGQFRIERGDHVDQESATMRADKPEALLQSRREVFGVESRKLGDRV